MFAISWVSSAITGGLYLISLTSRQFWSYLCGAKFTLRTDHKSVVWLHRFKDTEGMMARWLHAQFQFSIIHRPGRDHGNADGLSRVPTSLCRQCTRPDCPPVVEVTESVDQPFDSESTGSSEDADLILIYLGKTGWLNSTMTYLNRQLLLVTLFVFRPSNERILSALHYTHGFRRVSSPPGLR